MEIQLPAGRNSTIDQESMSHVLGGQPAQPADVKERQCGHFKRVTSYQNYSNSVSVKRCALLQERSCQIPSLSDLKQRRLGLYKERHLNKSNNKNNNKMSIDMGSIPDPEIITSCSNSSSHCFVVFNFFYVD